MRLIKLIFLLAALLLFPVAAAWAEPQEQFILNQISVGNFDVWQHTNGTWQDTDKDGKADPYGQTGKRVTETYTYPQSQYANQFTPTRVEITKITQASNLTDEELRNAGRSETWDKFYKDYLTKLPNNYSVAKTSEDIAQGTVTVEKILDLEPELLDLKDPTVRAELGMTDRDFSDMAQGWRWYTPVLIKWYGVPNEQQNLKVKITSIPAEDPEPGTSVTIKGQVTNEGEEPVTTLVQWYLDSDKVYEGQITIDKTRDLTFPFTMPDKNTLVTVQVNPGRNQPPDETTWEDNKDSAMINAHFEPVLNNYLKLTARSQGGKDVFGNYIEPEQRPAGKAKWTDIITAELTTKGPPDLGSCYNLKKWKLQSATIEYPKVHPEFTFGSPLEPVGTVTKEMDITGNRTATVQFKEDWSLNGANIYDVLKGQMVPGPTYYDIKVTYQMLWEYSKGERDCCGNETCSPCCVNWQDYTKHPTYTVSAKILVDGTAVNSLSQ